MAQRKSIAGAIRKAAHGEGEDALAPAPQLAHAAEVRSFRARTREGKKMIAAPVDPAAHRQLKVLAAEQSRAAEDLIREALRDLFTKYGKPAIT